MENTETCQTNVSNTKVLLKHRVNCMTLSSLIQMLPGVTRSSYHVKHVLSCVTNVLFVEFISFGIMMLVTLDWCCDVDVDCCRTRPKAMCGFALRLAFHIGIGNTRW